MRLGYNTNGFAHHDIVAGIEVLAGIGYRSVAITLDHATLNPFGAKLDDEIRRVGQCLRKHSMRSVIETGARYLLDPHIKHEPTLLSAAPASRRRIDFLCRAIEIAARLESDCVSLWSGRAREPLTENEAWHRLITGLQPVLEFAAERRVVLGIEPEPGMFVATLEDFGNLLARVDSPQLMLTLDVGHLHCLGELPVSELICHWAARLVNVHIEDMRRGVHEHLMFGEGEIDFPPVIRAFAQIQYRGGLHVELSRDSHRAPSAARQAYDFLNPLVRRACR